MKLAITIPTDLSEIKLSQYQKFMNIVCLVKSTAKISPIVTVLTNGVALR